MNNNINISNTAGTGLFWCCYCCCMYCYIAVTSRERESWLCERRSYGAKHNSVIRPTNKTARLQVGQILTVLFTVRRSVNIWEKKIVVYIRYTLICGYALLDFEHLNGKKALVGINSMNRRGKREIRYFALLQSCMHFLLDEKKTKKSKEVIQRCPTSLSFSVSLSAVHLVIL